MIYDFLNRNNNLDSLIILAIGIIIPLVSKLIFSLASKVIKKLGHIIKYECSNFKRRMTGKYTLYEIEKIQEKPENKRSKKEQKALDEYEEIMNNIGEKTKDFSSKIKAMNNEFSNLINKN